MKPVKRSRPNPWFVVVVITLALTPHTVSLTSAERPQTDSGGHLDMSDTPHLGGFTAIAAAVVQSVLRSAGSCASDITLIGSIQHV